MRARKLLPALLPRRSRALRRAQPRPLNRARQVRSAVLMTIDTRVPGGVAERYAAMHRSIAPQIAVRSARARPRAP